MFKRIQKSLSEFFSGIPDLDLSPEREKMLVEKIAFFIYNTEMELPATIFLKPMTPIMPIISQTLLLFIAPYMETLGMHGYECTAFFNNQANIQRILNRVEELKASHRYNSKGSK